MPIERDHNENDFQSGFGKYAKHLLHENAAYELKVTPTNRLNFNRLESHQLISLLAVKHRKLYYRIPDMDYLLKRPVDCIVMANAQAYIVIMFRNKDRGQKEFFLIDIDIWEQESKKSASLTEDRAREIGTVHNLV